VTGTKTFHECFIIGLVGDGTLIAMLWNAGAQLEILQPDDVRGSRVH
jgi:hypothetical protein